MKQLNRREFLCMSAALSLSVMIGNEYGETTAGRFFFTSQGRTAMMNADGSGLHYFDFDYPGQATWQPVAFFSDGRSVLLLSMEPRRDGPGRPFEDYYTQTPTHIWNFDLATHVLKELAIENRMAVFYTPQLLLDSGRMLVQVVQNKNVQLFNMNLDGSDAKPFTLAGEGSPYGFSVSPTEKRVAFHLAGSNGYEIYTSDTNGKDRQKIIGHPDHLYFGTSWSPDGEWILYADCHHTIDPGHDWADVCISRADGSEHRIVTNGQPMWFSSSYGSPLQHGNGSNLPAWTRHGDIIFPARFGNAKVPWEYQQQQKDSDHFNRSYKPELSTGGVQLCQVNKEGKTLKTLTNPVGGQWDFRASLSPDGKQIVFCRAVTGSMPAIWVMNADGSDQRKMTSGFNDQGADQPRWLPLMKERAEN